MRISEFLNTSCPEVAKRLTMLSDCLSPAAGGILGVAGRLREGGSITSPRLRPRPSTRCVTRRGFTGTSRLAGCESLSAHSEAE